MDYFFSPQWLKPLVKKLKDIRKSRKEEIAYIGNVFGDPIELAKYYVEPYCSHVNPADKDEDEPISHVRGHAWETINHFLNGSVPTKHSASSHLFVLSDAGMGKTSLLR